MGITSDPVPIFPSFGTIVIYFSMLAASPASDIQFQIVGRKDGEAVCSLTACGMLETWHGIGTRVRAVSRAGVIKPMTLFLRTQGQKINIAAARTVAAHDEYGARHAMQQHLEIALALQMVAAGKTFPR